MHRLLFLCFGLPFLLSAQSEDGFYVKSGLGILSGSDANLPRSTALGYQLELAYLKNSQGIALRYAQGYNAIGSTYSSLFFGEIDFNASYEFVEDFNFEKNLLNNAAHKMRSLSLEYLFYPKKHKGYIGTGLGISQRAPYYFHLNGGGSSLARFWQYSDPIILDFAGHIGHRIGYAFFEQSIFRGFKLRDAFYSVTSGVRLPIKQKELQTTVFPKDESSFVWDYQRYRWDVGWSILAYRYYADTKFIQVPQTQFQFGFSNHLTLGLGMKVPLGLNEIRNQHIGNEWVNNPISQNYFFSGYLLYDFPIGKNEFLSLGCGLEQARSEETKALGAALHIGLKSGNYQNMLRFHLDQENFGVMELTWGVGLYKVKRSSWRPEKA